MALYTRTGDRGFTLLPGPDGGGSLRLRKDDPRLVALGELDEFNAQLGLCLAEARRCEHVTIVQALEKMQRNLFRVGSIFSALAAGGTPPVRLGPAEVARVEKQIDGILTRLPRVRSFLLPGGCELAARLHVARTLARRAERAVIGGLEISQHSERASRPGRSICKYLNRLSDLLFALARLANHDADAREETWKP